jgi:hypothetical protein
MLLQCLVPIYTLVCQSVSSFTYSWSISATNTRQGKTHVRNTCKGKKLKQQHLRVFNILLECLEPCCRNCAINNSVIAADCNSHHLHLHHSARSSMNTARGASMKPLCKGNCTYIVLTSMHLSFSPVVCPHAMTSHLQQTHSSTNPIITILVH